MMEPNNNIELPNVGSSGSTVQTDIDDSTIGTTGAPVESSMDIEQSVPTVAELTGKSESEDSKRPKFVAMCALYTLPFLVVLAVVIIVVVVSKNQAAAANDLRNMDGDEAFDSVVNYLSQHNVSQMEQLRRDGTFQNVAATWMAHGDAHSRTIPEGSPASKEGYDFIQRYIMALFYYQMGGKHWKYELNFLKAENTCGWNSWVVRPQNTIPMGMICNNNGLISALVFVGATVKGTFPSELSKLTTLRIIEMDVNSISGSIPDSFHTLTNLENLHLSHNEMKGTLPAFMGNYKSLVSIDVSFNEMDGTLPPSLGTLTELKGVAVDHNLFTGYPGFWQQPQVEYLFLEQNAFDGYLEETMITRLPSLKVFDISDNQFRGAIPPNLFSLSALQVIDLHDNSFTGSIPAGIPSNTALRFLALHKNDLSGKIGESIGNLQFLNHLDVSNNRLTGYTVNPQTGFGLPSLKHLTYLYLAANNFPAGPIPDWIRDMTKLQELSLKALQLDGTIPTWIGELSGMILLDLDDNNLRGSIPSSIGNLKRLQFLLLNRNELTEQVPVELGDLSMLRVLYIDNNGLQGNMEMICNRGGRFTPIMVADCAGTTPEVVCDCCKQCCSDSEVCNDDNVVPSNDPLWQFGYDRVFYSFGNYTGFFYATP
ncbi:leucine Rich Repeat [Seminavis robusta]|uniref:Leucine Rich Repeat n=1 Tax=Seminavis robusta TaxID=568900 RepID=A0A9N8DXX5_9STRA|nr:leucine Rich Repeat [Seminavis robusta]|eukprot:Sro452_g145860.1 leucine Rich Repeat (652) ;mRNA; f:18040-20297